MSAAAASGEPPSDQGAAAATARPTVKGAPSGRGRGSWRRRPEIDELPSITRLLTLTDGVVAIAITLIVFQLKVPGIHDENSAGQLGHALAGLGGEFVSYLVAFFVIGQFWLVHHRVFGMLRGHDEGLAYVNLLFLFTLTLMPFTSNLQGRYSENPLAIDVFAFNLMLASLSTTLVMVYGVRRGLLSSAVSPTELLIGRWRGVLAMGVLAVSAGVAWWSVDTAKYFWLALLLTPTVAVRLEQRQRQGRSDSDRPDVRDGERASSASGQREGPGSQPTPITPG